MPNPLSRFISDASIMIGMAGAKLFDGMEQLAALAMECVASWSHVEAFMLNMYMRLAGGEDSDAAAMYLALEGEGPKSAAIITLAQKRLTAENRLLLQTILALVSSRYKDRNKLCHWRWGRIIGRNDVALLSDPKKRGDLDRSKVLVYSLADLERIRASFNRISGYGLNFHFILGNHPSNREGKLYAKLSQEPEIAEKLNRLKP